MARAGVPRKVVMTVPTFAAAAAVAAQSELVTSLPHSLLRAQSRALGLAALSGPIPKHAVGMALCWHERTHTDPAASAFRALVRRAIVAR